MSDFVTESSLLKRAYIFLEDGEWENANEYFEKVLDGNPENPDAYLGKLLAEVRVHSLEELAGCAIDYTESVNYKRLMRYGDQTVRAKVNAYAQNIAYNAENARKDGILKNVANSLNNSASWRKADFDRAMELLKSVGDYKNAKELIAMCEAKYAERAMAAEEAQKERIYKNIADSMKDMSTWNVEKYDQAIEVLKKFGGYKQSVQLFKELEAKKAEFIRVNEKVKVNDTPVDTTYEKRGFIIAGLIIVLVIIAIFMYFKISGCVNYKNIYVETGMSHTVVLNQNGTVEAVGNNAYGQCDVENWENVTSVVAGYYHTVALRQDGSVVATGANDNGQCDVSRWSRIKSIDAGDDFTVGIDENGHAVYAGNVSEFANVVGNWYNIAQVACGKEHVAGIQYGGTVVAVGDNYYGQCNVEMWEDIDKICAGDNFTVGLKYDGTVVAIGSNDAGQCETSVWSDVKQISACGNHTLAIKNNGIILATGRNSNGQCSTSELND